MTTLKGNMLKKGKKGFTLTELAIVIAVIAILIAVLVPTFTSVITNAKVTAAGQEAHSAITAYTLETEGGLADGSVVVVDGQYYFEVNGGSIDTDNYTASIEGLNPYTWATNGDYASTYGNGKVTIYINGVSASLDTGSAVVVSGNVTVDNSGLSISGSNGTYYVTGTVAKASSDFTTWWNNSSTQPSNAFLLRTYYDVAQSSITKIVIATYYASSSAGTNRTKTYCDATSSTTETATAYYAGISGAFDGDSYTDWALDGAASRYVITYYTTDSNNYVLAGTITINLDVTLAS